MICAVGIVACLALGEPTYAGLLLAASVANAVALWSATRWR